MSDRTVRARIKTMKWIIEALEEDAEKHAKGQKAAGTRIRKALQEIRTEAQVARVQILKEQKDPGFPRKGAKPRAKRSQGWNALSEHLRF